MAPLATTTSYLSSHNLAERYFLYNRPLGWVREPNVNTRGTWDLLQACVVTIFFCTATSLHLNIAHEEHGKLHRMWTRFWWITANAVAPELCMCIAMTQYIEARLVLKDVKRLCARHRRKPYQWTMTHAFYYNMRGFVYRPRRGSNYSRRHGDDDAFFEMQHLEAIIELDLLRDITLPEDRIKAFSSRNRLAKTVAIVQAVWFLMQTFARIHEHLPASPFEITAVAYITVTVFSYALWLAKPQDVEFSTELRGDHWAEVFELIRHRMDDPDHKPRTSGFRNQLPNRDRKWRHRDYFYIGSTWIFVAGVFGGLHLLAWNYEFPTADERLLWRVSAVSIMALPPAFYFWEFARFIAYGQTHRNIIGLGIVMFYVAARMYNFVEIFFSLRSTPPALYQTVQWTVFLPHF